MAFNFGKIGTNLSNFTTAIRNKYGVPNPTSPTVINSPSTTGGLQPYRAGVGANTPGGIATISDRYGQPNQSTGIGQSLFEDFRTRLGATGFQPIQEQEQSYFDSVKQGMKEDLRNEFFGSGGRFETGLAAESAAGRLGSPVAQRMLQNTVTEPFARAATTIDRNVFQLQQESRNEIGKLNAELNQRYNEIAFRISQAERGVLSEEQITQLDADLRAYEARLDYAAKSEATAAEIAQAQMEDKRRGQELSIDYLRTPIEYNESTQGIGSSLNESFGGQPLPQGGPVLTQSNIPGQQGFQNNFSEPGRATNWTPQYNALPTSGQFYGQIIQGPDGRNYAWRGDRQGWQVVYS